MMDIKLSSKTVEQTKKCEKHFSCLKEDTRSFCEGIHADGENVLFISSKPGPCPYKIPYGSSHICSCPARNEIYRRYHI